MRIIAGEWRGRRIQAPDTDATRPMLDRVREALFSTLGDRVAGAHVLDLFSGSGSLGLEALSRGALHVRFVERAVAALSALKANVAELDVGARARIIRGDAIHPKTWRERDDATLQSFDLVFLDPPYEFVRDPNGRNRLFEAVDALFANACRPGALLVLHAPTREVGALRFGAKYACEVRTYGGSALAYVHVAPAPDAGASMNPTSEA